MRTIGVMVIVTLFFAGTLLTLTFAGAPPWFVWMVASIATIVFTSKMIHLFVIGPVPAWGYLLIMFVVFRYVSGQFPWYVRDAFGRRGTTSGMGIADMARPSDAIKLEQGLFAVEERALRLQEDTMSKEIEVIYKGMATTGEFTEKEKETLKRAKEKLYAIRKEREKLKLLSKGIAPDGTTDDNEDNTTAGRASREEMAEECQVVAEIHLPISEPLSIPVRTTGCSQISFEGSGNWDRTWTTTTAVRIVTLDGRQFEDAPGKLVYLGDSAFNKVLRFKAKEADGVVTFTASTRKS